MKEGIPFENQGETGKQHLKETREVAHKQIRTPTRNKFLRKLGNVSFAGLMAFANASESKTVENPSEASRNGAVAAEQLTSDIAQKEKKAAQIVLERGQTNEKGSSLMCTSRHLIKFNKDEKGVINLSIEIPDGDIKYFDGGADGQVDRVEVEGTGQVRDINWRVLKFNMDLISGLNNLDFYDLLLEIGKRNEKLIISIAGPTESNKGVATVVFSSASPGSNKEKKGLVLRGPDAEKAMRIIQNEFSEELDNIETTGY